MKIDEASDQTSDIYPHLMAAHARLKNKFTEDENYHNLMRWFIKDNFWEDAVTWVVDILKFHACFITLRVAQNVLLVLKNQT